MDAYQHQLIHTDNTSPLSTALRQRQQMDAYPAITSLHEPACIFQNCSYLPMLLTYTFPLAPHIVHHENSSPPFFLLFQ